MGNSQYARSQRGGVPDSLSWCLCLTSTGDLLLRGITNLCLSRVTDEGQNDGECEEENSSRAESVEVEDLLSEIV